MNKNTADEGLTGKVYNKIYNKNFETIKWLLKNKIYNLKIINNISSK